MALWLIMMFLGLIVLGFVFYKVWATPAEGIDRRWFLLALAGTLISVAGLIMTLRSIQKEPAEAFLPPHATIEKTPPAAVTPVPTAPAPPPTTQEKPVGTGMPTFNPQQYPEDPKSPSFTKEEISYLVNETNRILNSLEEEASKDMKAGNTESMEAKGNRWGLFNMDLESWVIALRNRGNEKKGPNTSKVRSLLYGISTNLILMERNYHNRALLHDQINDNYIAELRSQVEHMTKELETLGINP